jgi:hypothetical protein
MKSWLLASFVGISLSLATTLVAAEPSVDLAPKEALRLIAMRSRVPAASIELAFIVDGSSRLDAFDARHVRRVAAIHGVREGTSQRRKLVFYDLLWNESLGWFMWENRDERAGEAVYLWSELKGEIVNR